MVNRAGFSEAPILANQQPNEAHQIERPLDQASPKVDEAIFFQPKDQRYSYDQDKEDRVEQLLLWGGQADQIGKNGETKEEAGHLRKERMQHLFPDRVAHAVKEGLGAEEAR